MLTFTNKSYLCIVNTLKQRNIMEEKGQKRKDENTEQQKVNKTWLAFGKLKGALTILDPNLLL
ncbi:Uncharacterised protein [Segatella buccae]|uniref:Uncharacterized protein n=1 Tax=Segatella buccae TaxID=28126 RepID=A0AAQ1UJE2_9BACT|nr:Uncharacterised protein [Segatella buccae]